MLRQPRTPRRPRFLRNGATAENRAGSPKRSPLLLPPFPPLPIAYCGRAQLRANGLIGIAGFSTTRCGPKDEVRLQMIGTPFFFLPFPSTRCDVRCRRRRFNSPDLGPCQGSRAPAITLRAPFSFPPSFSDMAEEITTSFFAAGLERRLI